MPNDSGLLVPAADRSVADLALAGLRQARKTLPPKLFYDEEGCRLFYRITELPEYYLTRTERRLLEDVSPRVLEHCTAPTVLVEYGASDEAKALHLLQPAFGSELSRGGGGPAPGAAGPKGAAPTGTVTKGAAPTGAGPTGAGPTGARPKGAGPGGAGPGGAGPAGAVPKGAGSTGARPGAAAPVRHYVPIDVAEPALAALHARLQGLLPWLAVHPVVGDFLQPIALPAAVRGLRPLGFFPGSTIGNLDPAAACGFLCQARATLGPRALFLVGADLRKDPALLLPAYDDAQGVTAAFNRNLLVRLNREAGADFDPSAFDHRAVWNDVASRIEMHLVSRGEQQVQVAGHPIHFTAGESIHTENSYKHTPEALLELAAKAGWRCRQMWTDPAEWFALYLLEPIPQSRAG